MKLCDHCGGDTNGKYPIYSIVWCGECIKDNFELLVSLDLIDRSRAIPTSRNWEKQKNIKKLQAIPPKGSLKKGPALESVKVQEISIHIEEPKFDFATYNGLSR